MNEYTESVKPDPYETPSLNPRAWLYAPFFIIAFIIDRLLSTVLS